MQAAKNYSEYRYHRSSLKTVNKPDMYYLFNKSRRLMKEILDFEIQEKADDPFFKSLGWMTE